MAAPSFIQEAETAWNSTTSPKTTASFNVVAGDILVAFAAVENGLEGSVALTHTGGAGMPFTAKQTLVPTPAGNWAWLWLWTSVVDSNKSMTVTFTRAGSNWFGGNVLTFRGSDGVGATSGTNTTGAPTLNLTTTQDNSAIVWALVDFAAAAGTRTARTAAGAFTSQTAFLDAAHYGVYGGYHADAGAIGTYAVGQSAPSGQTYAIAAVEITGTAGGGGSPADWLPRRGSFGQDARLRRHSIIVANMRDIVLCERSKAA